ncbi:MAG: hypothetical protein AAB459_01615 [Patescibacteria group bacterium]
MRVFKKPTRLLLGCLFLAVAVGIVWVFMASKSKYASKGQSEMINIKAKIARHVILPTSDEEPTLVTVTDKNSLKDPFLLQAENGDKVLLYPTAKKAYLYRPSIDRIIDVGPLTIDPSLAEIRDTTIQVVAGNNNQKSALALTDQLKQLYPSSKVSQSTLLTKRQDFPTTIVIDNTNDNRKFNLVSHIAKNISAQAGVMPLNEQAFQADVIIITGLDKD